MELHPRIKRVEPVWAGEPCIVAAGGPSLTPEVIQKVRFARWFDGWRVIAVNDVYKVLPHADVLYAVDNRWWELHGECRAFTGEKWAAHEQNAHGGEHPNDKRRIADAYDLNLIWGKNGDEFSFDPSFIRYGSNSGFQAINLALLKGSRHIVLVGFNMCHVNGRSHFFGDHPVPLVRNTDAGYRNFVKHYERAAAALPKSVRIVNATPDSALTCFPMMSLDEALSEIRRPDGSVHRYRPEPHAAAG